MGSEGAQLPAQLPALPWPPAGTPDNQVTVEFAEQGGSNAMADMLMKVRCGAGFKGRVRFSGEVGGLWDSRKVGSFTRGMGMATEPRPPSSPPSASLVLPPAGHGKPGIGRGAAAAGQQHAVARRQPCRASCGYHQERG